MEKRSNEYTTVWVHRGFKKNLKIEATRNNMSIFEFTRRKALEDTDSMINNYQNNSFTKDMRSTDEKQKQRKFEFKL